MDGADRYRELRSGAVREDDLLPLAQEPPEIEIQARWFDGAYGRHFRTEDGEPVEILQFGVWNREAGPDFAETAVRLGDTEHRGAIELDTDPQDWERHGHATNRDYENVVLHVCVKRGPTRVFVRTPSHRHVPQVFLDPLAADIDVPHEALAHPGRCSAPLARLDPSRALEVLEGAAKYRLQRKAAQLARVEAAHGRDEALYRAIATALGYKNNKLPFVLLAQRLPLLRLQKERDSSMALLLGVAGFLSQPDLAKYPPDTRLYLQQQWEAWWPQRSSMGRLTIPARAWHLAGLRPINHPQRRLAALRQILNHWPTVRKFARRPDAAAFTAFCADLRDPFWDFHYTLRSASAPKAMALLGASRASDILANVLYPLAFAEAPSCWDTYRKLPAELGNRRVSTAATRLFGSAALGRQATRRLMYQQGLLQVYEDFCMRDSSDCRRCLFPEQMEKWQT